MKQEKRKRKTRGGVFSVFLLLLLVLAGLLMIRLRQSGAAVLPPTDIPAMEDLNPPTPTSAPQSPESDAASASGSVDTVTGPEQEPTPAPKKTGRAGSGYNAATYQLVSDMIYIRRTDAPDGDAEIRTLEQQLREADPELGETWAGIMDYWEYANREMPINASLPDNLPQDDSLCLVVLGFQLLSDGKMAPELLGRCELALRCAQQYPNAFLAVTGGGTAVEDKSVTEAGVMADWFIAQGIAPERIIREDASLTTDQNAINTCAILIRDYPQVRQLAIISSDYHLPLGCTMFTEAALLCGFYLGEVPYEVVSNAAWATNGSTPGYSGMKNQASYVWIMADPKY